MIAIMVAADNRSSTARRALRETAFSTRPRSYINGAESSGALLDVPLILLLGNSVPETLLDILSYCY